MTPGLSLRDDAAAWLARGRPAMLVEVVRTQGSAPREAGTRMLVGHEEVLGTIGGGHLEWQAIAVAREGLARSGQAHGSTAPREQRFALGPSLGQCCGGQVWLRWSPLDAEALTAWPPQPPRWQLQLFGAGHVGRAIVRLLEGLPCEVRWIDERAEQFPPQPLAPHVHRVCGQTAGDALARGADLAAEVVAEVAAAPAGAAYLVATHSHELDLALARAILDRGDFGWFGLIGSATKRARFERRLAAWGIAEARIARMACPIGLPGIVGKAPEVIAVSVVAQLLMPPPLGATAPSPLA